MLQIPSSVVLGIDAAWTNVQPSGVALVSGGPRGWRCVAIAPSYAAFMELAEGTPVDWTAPRVDVGAANAGRILGAARNLAGANVDIVAIDLPIATVPIRGRRAADTTISREFGALGCATHSPTEVRPGSLSERLRAEFETLGFPIGTVTAGSFRPPCLLEVYPHVALLKLLSAQYRMKCKISKIRKYWPGQSWTQQQRIARLLEVWHKILSALQSEFDGLSLSLPSSPSVRTLVELKRYEDSLDALVSAWVGICFIEGNVKPYGDQTAAIWLPTRSGVLRG